MKTKLSKTLILFSATLLAASSASAQTITKADTTTMNTAADWGGTAPALTQTGVFTNVLSAPNAAALSLGGNVSLNRLDFQNINGPVTIASGNTLTLNNVTNATSAGIQMNNANLNHDVTINAALANVGTISVKTGRTLTLGGGATAIGGSAGAGRVILENGNYTTTASVNLNVGDWSNPSTTGIVIGNSGNYSVSNSLSIGRTANGIVRVNGTGAQFTATPSNQSLFVGRDNTKGLLQVDAGTLAIGQAASLGFQGSSEGILRVNGGIATVGTSLTVLNGANNAAASGTFEVNGGTTTVGGAINLGTSSTAGSANLTVTGGTLYIGQNGVGIATSGTGSTTHSITLSGGTIGSSTTTVGGGWSSSANMTLGTTNGDITFQSANASSAARSIALSGQISGAGGLIKTGVGNLTLSGVNTYTGNTTVNAGTLILSDNAGMTFNIGATGVNNQITGTGTVTLDGDFTFNLSGAAAVGTWNIVNVATLTETFGSTFSVIGFTDAGSNTWTRINGGSTYTFSETTGLLTAIPEPSTWLLLTGTLTALVVLRRRRA